MRLATVVQMVGEFAVAGGNRAVAARIQRDGLTDLQAGCTAKQMQRVTVLCTQAASLGVAVAVELNVTTGEPVAGKTSRQVRGNGGTIEGGDHHAADREPERVNTAVMIVQRIGALTSPGEPEPDPCKRAGQTDGD